MAILALTGTTGKLGSAVLQAILDNKLIDPKELVISTFSRPSKEPPASARTNNIPIRHATFDDPSSLTTAYTGCTALFLISSPRADLDYDDAPLWKGREVQHRAAIDAAVQAGVKHIYYTSIAFGNPSKAGVMRAHVRTEKYLKDLEHEGTIKATILREGLYNESWPLYLGYYHALKEDKRKEVIVAGDGPISWTANLDVAFATAKILAAPSEEWAGRTVYLAQKQTRTLKEVAEIVSRIKGEEVKLKIVGKKEYEDYYVEERGLNRKALEWWSSTYDALLDGECGIDDPTLEKILADAGRSPKTIEESIEESLR